MENIPDTAGSRRILFLGADCAVVNKAIGETCETGERDKGHSVVEAVRAELERLAGKPLPELAAVHRIDQPVSGCVLLAYTGKSCAALSEQFSDRRVKKLYRAIVEIPPQGFPASTGTLEHRIRFDRLAARARVLPLSETPRSPGWKAAALEWTLVGLGESYGFLEVLPHTGRTHQIRAQLAAVGMPIKGDLKYGARRSERSGGIRLHAARLAFRDVGTGEYVSVEAPVNNPDPLWLAFPGTTT